MTIPVLASVLLIGLGAAAQENVTIPGYTYRNTSSKASLQQGDQYTSDLCYAIRTFKVRRSEQVQRYSTPHSTDCTPASRFRAEYIPNLDFKAHVKMVNPRLTDPKFPPELIPTTGPECSSSATGSKPLSAQP